LHQTTTSHFSLYPCQRKYFWKPGTKKGG
jgi:hypothetical protein